MKPSSQPFMPATIELVNSSEAEGDAIIPLATNKDTVFTDSLDKPNESFTGNLAGGVAGSIVGLIIAALFFFWKNHWCGETKEVIPENDLITLS